MSLNWSIQEIKNYEELYEEDGEGGARLKSMTERLIFLTMETDIGMITPGNIDEWRFRLELMRRIGWDPRTPVTRTDLERHIGLKTNVWTTTRGKFKSKVMKHLEREVLEDLQRQAVEQAKEAER